MRIFFGLLVLLWTSVFADPRVAQQTHGWCSPAVADIEGSVTIVCTGVNPRALERLNELLDKKDLELLEKIREAEEWARQYRELEERLSAEGRDSELAREAEVFLKAGELEKGGALLDRLLQAGEQEVERVTLYQYSRAQTYALQFKPLDALPHYKKAYQYRPENPKYAHGYALALHNQNQYRKAEPVYREALKTYRELAQVNRASYLPHVAATLNNLGALYYSTQRLGEAEEAYQEALKIRRHLAEAIPVANLPLVAATLNNLGNLYS